MARHQSPPTVRDYGRRFNGGIIGSWPLVAVALFGLCLQPAPSASVLDSGWGSVLGSGLAGSLSHLISNLRGGRYASANVSVGGGIPGRLASASAGILSLRRTPGPVSPQQACETKLADERQEETKQDEDWIEYPNDEQCAILMQGLDIAREGSGLETYVSEVSGPGSGGAAAEEPEDASDLASVTAGADDTALATDSGTTGAADGEVRTKGRTGQAAESASKGRAGAYAGGRLKVLHTLGVGGFGTVYAAEDVASRALVALKVQRAGRVRSRLALDEIRLLERVARHQVEAAKERAGGGACGEVDGERGTAEWGQRVVALRSSFLESKGAAAQVCIETELLGPNLLDLIKDFRYQGCPLPLVKAVARAALEGLAFLHGRCRVIHTDIKPENILLTLAPRAGAEPLEAAVWWTRHSPRGCNKCKEKAGGARGLACEARWKLRKGWAAVLAEGAPGGAAWGRVGAKLVDLGNACVQDKHFTEDIQTVEYRSPEVVLGAGYGPSADLWSLACTLFELLTGEYLFDPKQARAGGRVQYTQEEDLLALHQELRGPMPREVRARARLAKRFFQPDGRLRHIAELKIWPLERVLAEKYRMPPPDAAAVAGFLLPMLELEPARRPSAAAMRAHPFLADHA